MRDTFPFLLRLGLNTDTDARSIRRAYARELKLIDQEQDGAGFQELREAYDSALQWAAWRDQQAAEFEAKADADAEAAPSDTSVTSPTALDYSMPRTPVSLGAAPAPEQPLLQLDDPQRIAAAVFEEFQAAIMTLLRQKHVQSPAQWEQALQSSLDDERLLNITARIYFEAHIAQLLANGWRPGHEILFVVAGKLFHWTEDRRRLQQLGRAGLMIDKAIDERNIFDHLPESELMIHRAAITLLRKDDEPSAYQLRGDMPYVEKLMAYFPAWMMMMVNLEVVEQWRASYNALPPEKKSWWPKFNLPKLPRVSWIAFFVLLQVLRAVFNHFDTPSSSTPQPQAAYEQPKPNAASEFAPLPEYMRQDIAARIPIFPIKLSGAGHQAEFNVVLDEQGKIYQIMMYRTSDSLSYDEAASKALRASQPFPPTTPRQFQVTFTVPTGSSQ